MSNSIKKPSRSVLYTFLCIYVLANVVAALIMSTTREMIGDVVGFPMTDGDTLFLATILIVIPYIVVLGPFFSVCRRIRVKSVLESRSSNLVSRRLGIILFVIQTSFLVFNTAYGVNIAGSTDIVAGSKFSYVFVLLQPDMLFFIYYSIYRNEKWFYPNVLVWAVSNVLRGWAGVFLFIAFFELCRLSRQHKLSVKKILMAGLLVLILLPAINVVKWAVRGSVTPDASQIAITQQVSEALSSASYLNLMGDGITYLIGRLQVTSDLMEVIKLKRVIAQKYNDGYFEGFWKEGILGIAIDRLKGVDKGTTFATALPQIGRWGAMNRGGEWNVNTGFLAWFFVSPVLGVFFIFYAAMLCFLSVVLTKRISSNQSALEGLWLAWLVYLLPPWINAFIGYVYALSVFLCLSWFFHLNFSLKRASAHVVCTDSTH